MDEGSEMRTGVEKDSVGERKGTAKVSGERWADGGGEEVCVFTTRTEEVVKG